jgi:two-component system, NtrC family, sensor histidine kinase PilS
MLDKHIWVIRLRYLISAVLAGSYILRVPLEQIFHQSYSMLALAAIVTVIVAANFIWIILLKRKDVTLESIGYYQCIFDLIVVSLIIHQYGASGLIGYMYVLVILVAGVLLPRKGIILIAAAASVLYLLLLLMEVYGYIVPLPPILGGVSLLPENIQFLLNVTIKVFFFYLIAISAANMQDLLSKTQKESEFLASFNQGIIDMIPMGVMVLDVGRNFVVYNPAMERTTFIPPDQAMGKSFDEVFAGVDDSWDQAITKVENSGEEVRLLGSRLPLSGGKEIRVNARIAPLKMNDQVLATVCVLQTATR